MENTHTPPPSNWADGPRGRFWGRLGAAGIFAVDPAGRVLLQHRAAWTHHGGVWGIPGGAIEQGEDAGSAALREAREETGLPAGLVRPVDHHVLDYGYWSYTTVVAALTDFYEPRVTDGESDAVEFVPMGSVALRPLLPAFRRALPHLVRMAVLGGVER